MNVQLYVERLILDGVDLPPRQRPQLQAALETELARLLAEGGLSPHLQAGGALSGLRAGDVRLPAGGNPAQMGQQIARAVYGGIGAQGEK